MNYKGQDLRPRSPHTFTVDTPLVFQWLPRKYGYLIPEKYVERLSEWAKRASTRVVKLVINGSGFTPMQRKELENKISNRKFNPNKNIELIDFNELDLGEYEFSFHLQKMWQIEKSKCPLYKVSQYFRDLYSIPEDERLSFGVEIDSMRIFMLLALKSPMIYFDFDILYQFSLLTNQIRSIAELFNCGRGKRGNKFTQSALKQNNRIVDFIA